VLVPAGASVGLVGNVESVFIVGSGDGKRLEVERFLSTGLFVIGIGISIVAFEKESTVLCRGIVTGLGKEGAD